MKANWCSPNHMSKRNLSFLNVTGYCTSLATPLGSRYFSSGGKIKHLLSELNLLYEEWQASSHHKCCWYKACLAVSEAGSGRSNSTHCSGRKFLRHRARICIGSRTLLASSLDRPCPCISHRFCRLWPLEFHRSCREEDQLSRLGPFQTPPPRSTQSESGSREKLATQMQGRSFQGMIS